MAPESDARSGAPAGDGSVVFSDRPSVLDATLKLCFDSLTAREAGVTRYQVLEHVRTWLSSEDVVEAERGFDEYVRTGRLVQVAQSRGGEALYRPAGRPDGPRARPFTLRPHGGQ